MQIIPSVAHPVTLKAARETRPPASAVPAPDRFESALPEAPGRGARSDSSALTAPALATPPASVAEQALGEHVPGEVLVKLRPGASLDGLEAAYGTSLISTFDLAPELRQALGGEVALLRLPPGQGVAEAVTRLGKDERVLGVAPNHVYRLPAPVQELAAPLPAAARQGEQVPNDLDPRMWGLCNQGQQGGTPGADIDALGAWRMTTGQREGGPIIAVLDTGVDFNHPDLANNLWTNPGEIPGNGIDDDGNGVIDDVHGYDATRDTGGGQAGGPHGTHCAGTIAAEGNNGQGVTGVNWQGRIMAVKIFPDDGDTCTAATILRAVSYATRMGARITSNSWTGGGYNPILKEAFAASPALHVIAAGNDDSDNDRVPVYPASFEIPNSVVVAASDRNDRRAFFSSYGRESVDIAAPGMEILSTVPDGQYAIYSGTSMATPHVAGVAGLVASAHPQASNQEIKQRLLLGSEPTAAFADRVASGGRLNAARAVSLDALPPGAPEDFSVRPRAELFMASWTAPGDSGWCGNSSAFEIRMSNAPITDEASFAAADLAAARRSQEQGKLERAMVHLAPASQPRTLYVGLRVYDKVGNGSEVVSKEVTIPGDRLAFEERAESAQSWTPEAPWGRQETERGPVWKVQASPEGTSASLTTRPIDLNGFGDSTLFFEVKHEMEPRHDFLTVEMREVGEQHWRRVGEFAGNSSGWKVERLPVHEFDGKTVEVRFRFEGFGQAPGVELRNVAVSGLEQGSQKP